MFVCEVCHKLQRTRVKPTKVVTEIRKVTYPAVEDKDGRVTKVPIGHETVKELDVCPACAQHPAPVSVIGEKTLYSKDKEPGKYAARSW